MHKDRNNRVNILVIISMVFTLLMGTVGTAQAAEFPKGETIPSDVTIDDDVFIGGQDVVIDGTINGILFAAGQSVEMNGTINGDAIIGGERVVLSNSAVIDGNLFVGAAEIVVNGTVTGTIFGGSASMVLGGEANVSRNFFYGGFSLTTEDGSQVGKDLLAGNYQSVLSGDVVRDLNVGAAAVQLNGSIGRDVMIEIGETDSKEDPSQYLQFNPYLNQYVTEILEPGVSVTDEAQIGGKLVYTSNVDKSAQFEDITEGSVIYQTPVPSESRTGKRYSSEYVKPFNRNFGVSMVQVSLVNSVRRFLKLMAIGALLLWLLRKPLLKIVEAAYAQPMKSVGYGFIIVAVGFLAVLIVPLVFVMVGVLIGFVSLGSLLYVWFGLVGTTLTLAAMLFFFAVFTISKIIAAIMFGKWMMKAVFKEKKEKIWLNLLVGVFLYTLIRLIPIIGWLAGPAATLIGTGAFWLALPNKKE